MESTDQEGDKITYEFEGKSEDNNYKPGDDTIKVSANDNFGGISEWTKFEFKVVNSTPTIPITIKASDLLILMVVPAKRSNDNGLNEKNKIG